MDKDLKKRLEAYKESLKNMTGEQLLGLSIKEAKEEQARQKQFEKEEKRLKAEIAKLEKRG